MKLRIDHPIGLIIIICGYLHLYQLLHQVKNVQKIPQIPEPTLNTHVMSVKTPANRAEEKPIYIFLKGQFDQIMTGRTSMNRLEQIVVAYEQV